jgi:hypothetical protein
MLVDSVTVYICKNSKPNPIIQDILLAFNALISAILLVLAIINRNIPEAYNVSNQLVLFVMGQVIAVVLIFDNITSNVYSTTQESYYSLIAYIFIFSTVSVFWIVLPTVSKIQYFVHKEDESVVSEQKQFKLGFIPAAKFLAVRNVSEQEEEGQKVKKKKKKRPVFKKVEPLIPVTTVTLVVSLTRLDS